MARQVVPKIWASPRLALVGDAAHALPPDRRARAEPRPARRRGDRGLRGRGPRGGKVSDIGGLRILRRYEQWGPAARTFVLPAPGLVDGLNQALLTRFAPVDFARGAGLAAPRAIGPLRRLVMRAGVVAPEELAVP